MLFNGNYGLAWLNPMTRDRVRDNGNSLPFGILDLPLPNRNPIGTSLRWWPFKGRQEILSLFGEDDAMMGPLRFPQAARGIVEFQREVA